MFFGSENKEIPALLETLENISANIMIADANRNIVYMN